jgi:hypothetical protein
LLSELLLLDARRAAALIPLNERWAMVASFGRGVLTPQLIAAANERSVRCR